MSATLSEEQKELAASAARFLEEKASSEAVRSLIESDTGYDEQTWKQMAELGWLGIAIPEEFGGIGFGFMELTLLLEQMGKRLLPGPFLASGVMAASAILQAGSDEQKKKYLPGIADGSTVATLAFVEPSGSWGPNAVTATATQSEGSHRIDGTKMYVLDGQTANLFVVAARVEEGTGVGLFIVDGDDQAVERKAMETLDLTRRQSRIEFKGASGELLGELGGDAFARTLDLSAAGLAAEMVGTAQQALDLSVEYANTRIQFGRPIGSFQAVKHKAADMLIELENARSAAYYAAWAASEQPEELPVAASIAKAASSDMVYDVAAKAIQIHGGIGFTWEHDAHLYFRRAKSQEIYLGDAVYHRALLAERLGL